MAEFNLGERVHHPDYGNGTYLGARKVQFDVRQLYTTGIVTFANGIEYDRLTAIETVEIRNTIMVDLLTEIRDLLKPTQVTVNNGFFDGGGHGVVNTTVGTTTILPNIDWSKPIEAYHPDGCVEPVEVSRIDVDCDYVTSPTLQGGANVFRPDGSNWGKLPWRIRNRAAASPPTISRAELFAAQVAYYQSHPSASSAEFYARRWGFQIID